MDLVTWQRLLEGVDSAKRMPSALYVHPSAMPEALRPVLDTAHRLAGEPSYSLLKLYTEVPQLSFLHYPNFDTEAFPVLRASATVDLSCQSSSSREYDGDHAPVLHRKELMLPPGDSRCREWAALTRQAEEAGLFQHPSLIGTYGGWMRTLAGLGLRVEGHALVPVEESPELILRHRTALVRYSMSTPMQTLLQHGFLNGSHSVFDYGCGRGGDLAQLAQLQVQAGGWDPHYASDQPKLESEVVNIGFVLNVIENPVERVEAMQGAWNLTRTVLSVAVLIAGRSAWEKHRLYRDGVITSKGTFQKYFTQDELRQFIQQHTGRRPIAMAPGLFFVFRSDQEEQTFLVERLSRCPRPTLLPQHPRPSKELRPPREPRAPRPEAVPRPPRPPKPTDWELHGIVWEAFWERCLTLGRTPEEEELDLAVKEVGGIAKALRQCVAQFGEAPLLEARANRMADLGVWLALGAFEKRGNFTSLSRTLQRDIRVFWGGWAKAQEAAKVLLFSAGDPKNLMEAAQGAPGWLRDGALYVLGSRTAELPAVLRVVVGCAGVMYGAVEGVDILKIHLKGGKVTLLNFDDFERLIPDLVERVKIDLRHQDLFFFSYDGEPYQPQPYWHKARLLAPDHPDLEALRKIEACLDELDLPEHVERPVFERLLREEGIELRGMRLKRVLPRWLEEGKSSVDVG